MILMLLYGVLCAGLVNGGMTLKEKQEYRDKVIDMFFHAYDSYMEFAYPADELMPLSCRGRVRGMEPSRGDIDDSLGSFSLTLIDSLDTLAVIGAIQEFNDAIQLVIKDVKFNADLRVSVFETNIRVLGGLLGGHFAAEALKSSGHPLLQWYNDELVAKAVMIADKLLPAFNTTTGIPYGRVNLRYGVFDKQGRTTGDTTCTACAGTMLMEFGALSRLTGDPKYEHKARVAMEALWDKRHHTHNLLGNVINVSNGQWLKKESGVGAGIDSYYEYCLKSYILLGDREYLRRFDAHYSAIMQYVSDGPNLFEVHMNTPTKTTKRFMDSLLAFWPGLQVLWGDITSAVETHNMLYKATVTNKFLPEAFSPEFKPVWPQYPLRPEFIESTYFLYKATNDPYYLDIGKFLVDSLEKYAWVPCGYAALRDVRRASHEDRFDSYVLAETFKYLFLLFAENDDLLFDIDKFIFTTEAHILPLSLSNTSLTKQDSADSEGSGNIVPSQCPSTEIPWTDVEAYRNLLNMQCSGPRSTLELDNYANKKRNKKLESPLGPGGLASLKVLDFGNPTHLMALEEMGINFKFQDGGKVILTHRPENAVTIEKAAEGSNLLKEVMNVMKTAGDTNDILSQMKLLSVIEPEQHEFVGGPAMFGPRLGGKSNYQVEGRLVMPSSPVDGCSPFDEQEDGIAKAIPLIPRGGCMFIDKVRNAQKSGAIAAVIYDSADSNSNTAGNPVFPFTMSGDGVDDVHIPSLLISRESGIALQSLIANHGFARVRLSSKSETQEDKVHDNTLNNNGQSTSTRTEQQAQSNQSSP